MGEERTKDREEVYINIYDRYQEVVATEKSVTKWVCSEIYDLMQMPRDPDNGPLVTHAVQFILYLKTNYDLPGINIESLSFNMQKQAKSMLFTEIFPS